MVMKDIGTCCFFLPLKAGVGIISMLVWVNSLVCILALLTGDVRFQPTGYNLHFYRLPPVVGVFGIVIGFFGVMGAYEDKHRWVYWLNRFLVVKIVADIVTRCADYYTLRQCDSWLDSTSRQGEVGYGHAGLNWVSSNPQLSSLAEAHVCPWARWAYLLGAALDTVLWCYFLHRCYMYELHLAQPTRYQIDFGVENSTGEARWRLYQVKGPQAKRKTKRGPAEEESPEEEESIMKDYGSTADTQTSAPPVPPTSTAAPPPTSTAGPPMGFGPDSTVP